MKIVLHQLHGRFKLSNKAVRWLADRGQKSARKALHWAEAEGTPLDTVTLSVIDRDDPLLVQCVEELGDEADANGQGGLVVVETPDHDHWLVRSQGGAEYIMDLTRSLHHVPLANPPRRIKPLGWSKKT